MRYVSRITASVGFIIFLTLVLMIPLLMIQSVISEREAWRDEAVAEISQSWGTQQHILGPVLTVPYRFSWIDHQQETHTEVRNAYFLPDSIQIDGSLAPEVRYRGIYQAVLYQVAMQIRGTFPHPDFSLLNIAEEDVLWDEAFVSIGIPDMRGIKEEVKLTWNQQQHAFRPGTNQVELYTSGMHVKVPEMNAEGRPETHAFAFDLALHGSKKLQVFPLGKETKATFTSPWPHPKFTGAFLPSSREVTSEGFTASWELTYFGRSYPQQWKAGDLVKGSMPGAAASLEDEEALARGSLLHQSAFGVELLYPVDAYVQSERSVKYGILFIALTFLAFFLFEVLSALRIHPLQYLLVGFAICLFYLLLISLSEHLDFLMAYLAGSLATTLLIFGYVSKVLQSVRRGLWVLGILLGLYAFLYVLLQMEAYALLLGSLGLFLILAFVMYLTRSIDWYAVNLPRDESASSTS